MEFYIITNKEMPWGDYGDLLLSGISNLDENGQKIIERTGPYLPPMYISGFWDLIVSNGVRDLLEKSPFTGFKLRPIKKGKIVEINWDKWIFESDTPAFYPQSGEPEDYIFDGEHSDMASNAIGQLWILELVKAGQLLDGKLTLTEHYDFFMPENKGIIIVAKRAKQWLEDNMIADWISFQKLPPSD